MSNQYGLFWNSESNDRLYDADSFAEWLRKFFTSGVFANELEVTVSSGMDVSVSPGYCNLNGKVRFFELANTFTIAAAHSTYPRIDTVVIERNDTDREITMKIVTGEYSGLSPVATEPVRTGSVYQLILAEIYVDAGTTSLSQADITDKREDSDVCGYVTGTVDEIDWSQITAQFNQYYTDFTTNQLAEFLDWFNAIKDQLDEDAAGHLQNEVNNLADDLADAYDPTATYAVGDYCIHDNVLYICNTAISSAEAWTAAHWTATTVADEIGDLKSDLDDVQSKVGPYMFSLELDADVSSATYGELCLYLYYPDGATPPPITLEGDSLYWTY